MVVYSQGRTVLVGVIFFHLIYNNVFFCLLYIKIRLKKITILYLFLMKEVFYTQRTAFYQYYLYVPRGTGKLPLS